MVTKEMSKIKIDNMKKFFTVCLLYAFLSSCGEFDNCRPIRITGFESSQPIICKYIAFQVTNMGYNQINFLDTCGKYKIGDTIQIIKYLKH